MRIVLFCEQKYAINILTPIQEEALKSGGHDILWYVHSRNIPDFPLKDRVKWTDSIQKIYDYSPEAIFVPCNIVPYYLPGVKIQIFHGYAAEKKDHWVILINSFGTAVMAGFAAAVKIDSFAYMPVQDFGNAFSTFIAQNFGAGKHERIRKGIRVAVRVTLIFCLIISVLVFVLARPLMLIFIPAHETEIISIGVEYLRIEGAFYCGIGWLFLLYGFYRAVRKPGMSVVLTVISLGVRVALAYTLAAIPGIGVWGIWWSIPIGWFLADIFGWCYYRMKQRKSLEW